MAVLLYASNAIALLVNNDDGTVTQFRNDGSVLMWLRDANTAYTKRYDVDGRMSWDKANTWIASLNSSNYLGHNDWRLPDASPVDGSAYDYHWTYNGSSDVGYNISAPGSAYPGSTGSEMAYMFYTELGNKGYYDISGSGPQPGWGLINKGPFINMELALYWIGADPGPYTNSAKFFFLTYGNQGFTNQNGDNCAWAVRTVVPELIADPNGPYSGTEGQAIILDGSGSTDSDGTIVLYEWDIDDDGVYDYSDSIPTASHTYAQQGTYTVKLRVTDDDSTTDEEITTADISDTSPTAYFTGAPANGAAPLMTDFTNNSTGFDQPLSYEWDFDNDGTTDSTQETPSNTYNDPGTYSVKLTVTDADGSPNIITRLNYITVTPPLYSLTVSLDGIGTGTVTSSPAGISCGPDCAENYVDGTAVTLTAMPDAGSTFTEWTGCDSPNGPICEMTVDAIKDVTAVFDSCMYPARIAGTPPVYFDYIQDAYNNTSASDTIESQDYLFVEDLTFGDAASIIIKAGYDCSYSTNTGITTISGNVTISNGTVTIQSGTLTLVQ